MQTNLVRGRFAQNGPQDRENQLFGVFVPFQTRGGAAEFIYVPRTSNQKPVNRELRSQEAEPSKVQKGCTKADQRKRGSDEPKKLPKNSPAAQKQL